MFYGWTDGWCSYLFFYLYGVKVGVEGMGVLVVFWRESW